MEKINQELARLILRHGGNKAEIAKRLGITPQGLGNYERGRKIPVDVITKWKREFGDDLLKLSETNVSHETRAELVLPGDVWHELKENNAAFKLEIERLWAEREKFWSLIDRLAPVGESSKPHK